MEVKEEYQVKISNRFACSEILDDDNIVDINRAWESTSIRENIKSSPPERFCYDDLKQHKYCSDEECSKVLDQRKQAKLQWLQSPSHTYEDNLNNVIRETHRSLREKEEYQEEKIKHLVTKGKNKVIRGVYKGKEFKKRYRPRTELVNDENCDLLAHSRSILNRWKGYFCQLLNVHGVNDIRQRKMQIAEPLVPENSSLEVDIAIEKLLRYKSPGVDQIPAQLIQAGKKTLSSQIQKLFNSIWNKEELSQR